MRNVISMLIEHCIRVDIFLDEGVWLVFGQVSQGQPAAAGIAARVEQGARCGSRQPLPHVSIIIHQDILVDVSLIIEQGKLQLQAAA